MAKYHPYLRDGSHGMDDVVNGQVRASTFFKAYNDDGVLAKPNNWLFLTGFDYTFKADGPDKDKTPDWHIDFKVIDADGDFSNHRFEIDTDLGNAYRPMNFFVDPMTGDLVGLNPKGQVVVIDTEIVGGQMTYHIDNEVLQDITGLSGTVVGKIGGEHFGENDCDSFFQLKLT